MTPIRILSNDKFSLEVCLRHFLLNIGTLEISMNIIVGHCVGTVRYGYSLLSLEQEEDCLFVPPLQLAMVGKREYLPALDVDRNS